MKTMLPFILILSLTLHAQMSPYLLKPSKTYIDPSMKIKILDTKQINFTNKNNIAFNEISDLAYKDKKLFAVGDNGFLYTMSLLIVDKKIKKLQLLNATALQDEEAKKLKKKYRDSEGLVFVGNKLAISFERKHRVDLYGQDGIKIRTIPIHKDLRDKKAYQGKNKGLEALAYNEKYGIVTAPERPLKNKKLHTIYAKKRTWEFQAKGSITGLEFRSKNKLVVLLRDFNHFTRERVITLVELNLKKTSQKPKLLARLESSRGWNVDNFEGITKVKKNTFLLVSDDNDSVFQKTLLVLFEIRD